MPREWRSIARFAAWRRTSEAIDGSRLVSGAAGAFVDRRAIDWSALLGRVRTPRDRALVQALHLLDQVRATLPDPAAPAGVSGALRASAGVLGIIAAVQTVGCLGAIALAVATGDVSTVRLPQILMAVSFAVASVLLAAASGHDARSLFLVAAFTGIASAFARAAAASLPPAYGAWLEPVLRGLYPESFTPACVWLFALEFPRVRRFTAFDRIARGLAAAASLVGVVLFVLNLAAVYVPLDSGAIVNVRRNDPGNGFWTVFAIVLVPALATIVLRSRRAGWAERRRLARFAAAIGAGSAPVLIVGLLRAVVPPFGAWLSSAAPAERLALDALVLSALMAMPILATAALVIDRPFDRQELLPPARRRAILRAAVRVAAAAPFAVFLTTVYRRRHLPLGEAVSRSAEWWLLAWMAGGLLLLARRRRHHGDPGRRNPQLANALDRLRAARGAAEISAILEAELRTMSGGRVRVLAAAADGFRDRRDASVRLEPGCALLALLGESTRPLDCSPDGPLFPLLPAPERGWLMAHDVALVAAVRQQDGAIAAVAVLGPKPQARPFTRRDRSLVATLVSAASAAWEIGLLERSTGSRLVTRTPPPHERAAFECRRCGIVSDDAGPACDCSAGLRPAALPKCLAATFVVERRLGAGSIGVVYRARDIALRRDVALKALPNVSKHTAERVRECARAMARLGHESLATLYGLEQWLDTPVLVMEYLPGGTLAGRLAAGRLQSDAAVAMTIDLARALEYMHARGVLHLNVKPGNIGFDATGRPKLLDAGLPVFGGTARYRPPEARHGARPSTAFDLWALSIVLAESAGSRPAELDALLGRALDRVPARRYRSATDFLLALEREIRRTQTRGQEIKSS